MIPLLHHYQLVTPASLAEALDDLARHPEARPFAGGTDLMVVLEAGHLPPGRYVSLPQCRELTGIEEAGGGVSIGALTTYTTIRHSTLLASRYPMLGIAASETGGLATQNRGTIGGNIANASPAADTPPALLVYDAELELVSAKGTRRVPYRSFHQGYKKMDLAPGELIARIDLPPKGGRHMSDSWRPPAGTAIAWRPPSGAREGQWCDYYRKVGTRRAQAISKVCFAGSILMNGDKIHDVRIALGSVAPTVLRATRTEEALRGQTLDEPAIAAADRILVSEIAPIDDIRSTARYRARVARNLLGEFLRL
ncbi:MAG TPA: xanthine dehydrogenase family protein subunit M [Vicinamibacterales bacterium]